MYKTGVVHGRFQLLHNDHVKFILEGLHRCEHLIVGICNPDVTLTSYNEKNPHRSTQANNPFTYYERYEMIKGTLLELGIGPDRFDIVPFPINMPELIFNYAPRDAKYFLTIYDEWGMDKKKELEAIGCDVEVMWQVELKDKGISGTDIRNMIRNGEDYKAYVPNFVYHYFKDRGLDERLMHMSFEEE